MSKDRVCDTAHVRAPKTHASASRSSFQVPCRPADNGQLRFLKPGEMVCWRYFRRTRRPPCTTKLIPLFGANATEPPCCSYAFDHLIPRNVIQNTEQFQSLLMSITLSTGRLRRHSRNVFPQSLEIVHPHPSLLVRGTLCAHRSAPSDASFEICRGHGSSSSRTIVACTKIHMATCNIQPLHEVRAALPRPCLRSKLSMRIRL